MADSEWSQPHHDDSALYVAEPNPKLGGRVNVFLRVPRVSDITRAWVRVINDGEPELLPAAVVGAELVGLAGAPDLRAGSDGLVTLPDAGPAFAMWCRSGG